MCCLFAAWASGQEFTNIISGINQEKQERERCELRGMGQAERASWRGMTRDGLEGWVRLRGIQGHGEGPVLGLSRGLIKVGAEVWA